MGSLLHPVGPEQSRVYWARRALVALTLVVIGALVWWAWPKSPPVVSAAPPPAPTTGTRTTSATTPSPSPTPAPTTPAAPQACDPASLRLTVAGFQKVKLSAQQVFAVSAINGGAQPCVLTISPQTYTLAVVSGKDKIWTTADCKKWLPAEQLTLQPETAHEFEVKWPLARSKATCKTTKAKLNAGTYVATATYQGKATARQVIQLVK
jgi:hypothetical protein